MKSMSAILSRDILKLMLACVMGLASFQILADSTPELFHYKFSGTGTSVPNLASTPPMGAETAAIQGGITQGAPDFNNGGGGGSLIGSGVSSSSDFLNTGWAPNIGSGSWTISFVSSNITPSATLFYVFGDINTASFRCFTNGVAGAQNWILRGAGLVDILILGGATVNTHRNTFVYDSTLNNVKAYLDGVLVSTVAQGTPNLSGTGPLKVMGYSGNVGVPAGGFLDDFRIYSRALSETEVNDIDKKPIVSVTGNTLVISDGDTTPDISDDTDFGGVLTSNGSVVRTYTILNNGNLDLLIGSISFVGEHAADFTVTTQPNASVPASGTTTFQVSFDPSADGIRVASLNMVNNDPAADPFNFDIQGMGLAENVFLDGFE